MGVVIRLRAPSDIDRVVAIAGRVQARDGYPGRRPRDLRSFLVSDDALDAWVAERDGRLVGHVALHRESLPVVMSTASRLLRCSEDELAVAARLIVDPDARRAGAGRALLDTAARAATSLGRRAILDVATHYTAANALYRSCGWTNLGEVVMTFGDGTSLRSYVYAAPGPPFAG